MTKKQIGISLIILFLGFVLGYLLRPSTKTTEIKYVKLPPITDTIKVPEPYQVEIPSDPEYIFKKDTIYQDSIVYVHESIDTLAILSDWIKKRSYETVLFDVDTLGKITVFTDIQYNKLQSLSYKYIPIQREVTQTKSQLFTPYIQGGLTFDWYPSLEVGTYIRNISLGIEATRNTDTDKFMYGIKIGYKFSK